MKHKFKNLYWFFLLIIYLEIVYRIFIFNSFFSLDLLLMILFSVPISILFYIICNLFNEKVNKFLVPILSFIIIIIFGAQIVYYNFYQSMFSLFSLMNGTTQVMAFAQDILKIMLGIWYILVLVFVPFVLYLIFRKKLFSFKRLKGKSLIIWVCAMLFFFGGTLLAIKLDNSEAYSLNRLYSETHAPMITAKKLGLLTMTRYDAERFLFGFEEKAWVGDTKTQKKEESIVIKYNKLDINFDNLIENETNEDIKTMHEYFKNVNATSQNEYTGLFKGKNLIFITAEGFDTLAIDDMLTPTLYELSTHGFIFSNFYQPLFPVSTSDGEYMNMTSLIPKEGVWSAYRSSKISMPFAIGNMFNKLDYKTNAYHNHSYKYYDRNLSHPNMGFNYVGCGNGLEKLMNCKLWPSSDLEMMEVTVDDYIYTKVKEEDNNIASSSEIDNLVESVKTNQNFATYYMTVSGHLNYSKMGNNMARRNWDAVSSLPYSEAIKAYIACNIEFDKAMKYLMDRLKEADILDDTVIVISPDHYPYGLKNERDEMSEILGVDKLDKFENYRTTLIIYNSAMKEDKVVEKYTSSIDILPTVYNLFGLEFDSRLLMGRDALSEDEDGLVILSDRSWITELGKYNSIKSQFEPHDENEVIPEGYVDEINNIVNGRFSMSSLILTNDYYSYLGLNQ